MAFSGSLQSLHAAKQALGKHGFDRRSHQKIWNAHFMETRKRAGRIVRVDGGENEMAGHRGFHRDLGCFFITDFSDHHHIGVLTQEGAQRRREIKPDLLIDVDLDDPRKVVLDGIFGR